MIAIIQRVINKFQRQPTDEECDRILEAIRESESPTACRVCGKRGAVQLSTGDRAEYLCYDDLGPFLELFADPFIEEFTVVRL